MRKEEAQTVLLNLLNKYRAKSYNDLVCLLKKKVTSELTTDSGVKYQVEFQAVWDDKADGNLRVIGSIDDGELRAFSPLTCDFIISPRGRFVGE